MLTLIIRAPSRAGGDTAKSVRSIEAFNELIDGLRADDAAGMPVAELAEAVLKRSGYLAELQASEDLQDASRIENLNELIAVARRFDATGGAAAWTADHSGSLGTERSPAALVLPRHGFSAYRGGPRMSGRLVGLLLPGHLARDSQRILQLLVHRRLLRDQFAARWRERVLSQGAQHVEITAGLQHDEQKGIDMNARPVAAIWITGRPSCQ
jgi:superfamily I DNA/RNA helicase